VRRTHFERFRPRCTLCALHERPPSTLVLGHIEREADGDILEGALVCPERRCRFEYPILSGIPIITTDVRATIGEYQDDLRERDDLSA
jgi:uncharacterized protein YbaR (Trm112 family)